ncbi:MAG TPA: ATP-grasp domain-containing protein, partial [Kribbellaceae bacterium]|nr:ATP-grasp domain-containing protein [Kribbellaceae bacterium]
VARTCDGLTTLADDSQATAAALAEDLGLPGIGRAAGAAARSKAVQRALCGEAGMPSPKWSTVRGPGDIRAYYAQERPPAVLKPVDGTGGSGVIPVHDLDDALRQWPVVRSLSRSRTAVIEDRVTGREVCVEAVVVGGRPVFVSVAAADHLDGPGFVCVSGRYASVSDDHPVAVANAQRLATALGIDEAILHAEFKVTDRGWVILETAIRPGGAFVPELTQRVSGIDLYEIQALLALGRSEEVLDTIRRKSGTGTAPHAQVVYLVAAGQVRRFVPPAHILPRFSDVRVVRQQAGPGQRVREPLSDGGRAGYVLGWGSDPRRLDAQLREAGALLCREMGLSTPLDNPTVRQGAA